MCWAGGHISPLWAKLQVGEAPHNSSRTYSHVSEREQNQNAAFIHSLYKGMDVCKFSWVCVIGHMCVYHDASPQLSHSFPAASRGWKRVKPQTSGAPQPIRIVYLASHGRLTEQEHTASHTALQGKPLLSCFPSFSTPLNSAGSSPLLPFVSLFVLPAFPSSQMQPLRDVPDVNRC